MRCRYRGIRKTLLLCLVCLAAHSAFLGQTVLLEQTVPDSGDVSRYGQNRRHYTGVLLGLGIVPGNGSNTFPVQWGSHYLKVSLFYKLKCTGLLAVVPEVGYRREGLRIRQTDEMTFPHGPNGAIGPEYKRERLVLHELPLALNLRLNFDPKRGNTVGNFLDVGVVYLLNIGSVHRYQYSFTPEEPAPQPGVPPPSEKTIVSHRGLPYIAASDYAIQARVGLTRFMFTAQYRLGEVLQPDTRYTVNWPNGQEWPRLSIGVQLGLY